MATLWDAALINDVSGVKNLLEDAMVPVDDANDLGETALHLAATKGHDDVVRVLLQHNANLVAKDWESGWTPLHRSMYNDHLSTSLLLLRHARFHFGKKFMSTYLHQVCDFANQSAIELLSSRLADIFQQTMMLAHYEQGEGGAMTRGGAVYTFGKADFQLGYHLPNADVQTSPRRVDFPTASAIVQISAGKYHTIALNALGECFVWGFGKGGRLGTGTEFDHVEPMKLMSLDQIPILKVAAGENHTLALSRSGQIFSWGSNSFGQLGHNLKTCTLQSRLTPKRIDAFRGSWMTDIAVSGCHSAAIRGDDGAVFTWGSNKKGQLGRKEGFGTDQPYPTPKLVDALLPHHPVSAIYEDYESVRAVQVALSDVHTSVILQCTRNGQRHGQVWQFGYGSNYPSRINFKEKAHRTSSVLMSDVWTPTWKVRGVDIVQISCAQNHSIALAKCGSVYTWGHNGQALSHHKKSGQQSFVLPGAPQSVSRLANYGRVTSICASQDHCAVVTEDGNLITWGCGAQNVLGHGQGNTWQPNPKRVAGVKKALAVTTGHQHTAVLVASYNPAPLTVDEDALSGKSSVPTLLHLVQRQISKYVDLTNCVTLWKYGAHFSAAKLDNFASEFMRLNWDAVLEMMGKERMDLLFELFLPPMESMKALELKATAPPQATGEQAGATVAIHPC
uniref:Uncharacterized protein n=1 Tax=Globisporangium ultimum (strain ATCC 200006 / CBS 805.95 / DAOM BR144) TaxID=431595 RepID=K3XAU5_GLOUD